MPSSFDDTLSLPRKLTRDESTQLQERLSPLIRATQDDEDEFVSDLLDYAVAMVSNSKTIRYVIDNLIGMDMEFCNAEVAEKIGENIYDYLCNTLGVRGDATAGAAADNREDTNISSNDNESDDVQKARIAVIKAKSDDTGSGNALTMSGALGASRQGGRLNKAEGGASGGNSNKRNQSEKKTNDSKLKDKSTLRKDDNNNNNRRDRQGRAFDRLVSNRGGEDRSEGQRNSSTDDRRGGGRGDDERGGGRGNDERRGRGDDEQRGGGRNNAERRGGRGADSQRGRGSDDRRGGGGGRGRGPDNRRDRGPDIQSGRGGRNPHSGGRFSEGDNERSPGDRGGRYSDDRRGGRSFDDRRDQRSDHQLNKSSEYLNTQGRGRGVSDGGRDGPRGGRGSGRDDRLSGNRRSREPYDNNRASRNDEDEADFIPAGRGDGRGGRGGRGTGERFHGQGRSHGRSDRHYGRGTHQGRGEGESTARRDGDESYHPSKRLRADESGRGGDKEAAENYEQDAHPDYSNWDGDAGYDPSGGRGNWRGGRGSYRGGGRSGRGFGGRSHTWHASNEQQRPAATVNDVASGGDTVEPPSGSVAAHPSPLVTAANAGYDQPYYYNPGYHHGGRGRGRGRGRGFFAGPTDVKSILATKTWVRNKDTGNGDGAGGGEGG